MVAFGTAAPLGSLTVPATAPVVSVCANNPESAERKSIACNAITNRAFPFTECLLEPRRQALTLSAQKTNGAHEQGIRNKVAAEQACLMKPGEE